MRAFLAASALLLATAPLAVAEDPLVCVDEPDAFLFACAGGGVEGSCDTSGYRFNEVIVATLVAYVIVLGDSQCSTAGESTFWDNSVIVGAGTDVASASVWWYESSARDPDNGDFEGCLVMLRVFTLVGPLVIENVPCPAGQHPPRQPWGEILP